MHHASLGLEFEFNRPQVQVQPSGIWRLQRTVTPQMREAVVAWLSDASADFELLRETFLLAVNYMDRYLSRTPVDEPDRLQLLGVACLLLAAKYEEVRPPAAQDLLDLTSGGFK